MLKRLKLSWLNFLSLGLIILGILGLVGVPPMAGKLWLCAGLIAAGIVVDLSMTGRLRKTKK